MTASDIILILQDLEFEPGPPLWIHIQNAATLYCDGAGWEYVAPEELIEALQKYHSATVKDGMWKPK